MNLPEDHQTASNFKVGQWVALKHTALVYGRILSLHSQDGREWANFTNIGSQALSELRHLNWLERIFLHD